MYVKRNAAGEIVALSQVADAGCEEYLADHSAELRDYLERLHTGDSAPAEPSDLERSDQEMARVLEDVIYLLVDRGVILFTDLPGEAQSKLLARRQLRQQARGVDLLDDGDDLDI